jgi:hypothetical protein
LIQKLKELRSELVGIIAFESGGEHDKQLMASMTRSVELCINELLKFEDVADIFYTYVYYMEHGVYPKKKKTIIVYGKKN